MKHTSASFEAQAFELIDTWLDNRVRLSRVPGLQICVRKKGEIVFSKAYGYADIAKGEKLETAHFGHFASHSKLLTSAALHILEREKSIKFTDVVTDYVPELKEHRDKKFRSVTIEQLMSMRAGITRDGASADFWRLQKPFPSRRRMLQELLSTPLVYTKPKNAIYSNFGYALLGLVIEKASGESYERFVERRILDKLGSKAFADYKGKREFAAGHSKELKQRFVLKHASAAHLASATGSCANAEEMSLLFHKILQTNEILSSSQRKRLFRRHSQVKNLKYDRYGYGLHMFTYKGLSYAGHTGGFPGFSSATFQLDGSPYIASAIINSSGNSPLRIITSILRLLETLNKAARSRSRLELSPLLHSFWSSQCFLIGKTRCELLPMDSWDLFGETVEFRKTHKHFVSQTMDGFYLPGVPLTFQRDKSGSILSAKLGGHSFFPEKELERQLRRATR